MGFIDALALAGRAKSAYDQGQVKQTFQNAVLQQKEDAAAVDAELKRAQAGEADARAYSLRNPKPKLGTQSKDERLYARIQELGTSPDMVAQYPNPSKRLAAANERARMEFGEAPQREPQDAGHFTPFQGVDAQGNPIAVPFDSRHGKFGTPDDTVFPKPASAGAGMGSQAPVGDMEARLAEIEGHANDLAAGKWHPTRAMQAREGMEYGIANSSAGGHGVPLAQAGAIAGMNLFGLADGPDYQRFQALMNSTRSFGDDAAKVFKGRQNEDSVKREIALSQITPDDYQNPKAIAQKLQRMREVVALAKQTMPSKRAEPTGATGPAPTTRSAGGKTIIVNGKPFVLPE